MVTPIRRPLLEPDGPLERVRQLVLARVPVPGHVIENDPDLCFYRIAEPTTYHKRATFGVTLGVVLQGSKRVRIGDHEVVVDPARFFVITRDAAHETSTTVASPSHPYLSMSILFRPERVARALLALSDAGGPAEAETMPAFVTPHCPTVAGALERLLQTLDDPIDRKLIAPLILDEILFRLLRSDSAAAVRSGVARTPDALRILESMGYIRDHHPEKLTVDALAKHARMSPSHYAHRFSSVARITPMRFLREVRLERARALLIERGPRANEVAVDVGFESAAHFTREFKRRYGVPPSHYLRTRPR